MSDLYIYHRYIDNTSIWRWLWWIPTVIIVGFLIKFCFFHRGLVEEYNTTNLFLLLLLLFCLPKILFTLFALIPKVGTTIGIIAAVSIISIILWGTTFGFCQLKVNNVTYESEDIPESFDGYKIVQISDAHTGVFRGPYKHLLKESIDKINSLNPDLVCFVGDIENFSPQELIDHQNSYSAIKSKDGVLSIMGNHDYSTYLKLPKAEETALVAETRSIQRSFGWRIMDNENITIFRTRKDGTKDSIIVIGEENWGNRPFPQIGNLNRALKGLSINKAGKIINKDNNSIIFSLMLSHDPNAWRAHILPKFRPNITLSGHTHGAQFSIFGWSPASNIYKEWGGTFYDSEAMINVSVGLGGNFPFRFNMPREIVVITLKKKTIKN